MEMPRHPGFLVARFRFGERFEETSGTRWNASLPGSGLKSLVRSIDVPYSACFLNSASSACQRAAISRARSGCWTARFDVSLRSFAKS